MTTTPITSTGCIVDQRYSTGLQIILHKNYIFNFWKVVSRLKGISHHIPTGTCNILYYVPFLVDKTIFLINKQTTFFCLNTSATSLFAFFRSMLTLVNCLSLYASIRHLFSVTMDIPQ